MKYAPNAHMKFGLMQLYFSFCAFRNHKPSAACRWSLLPALPTQTPAAVMRDPQSVYDTYGFRHGTYCGQGQAGSTCYRIFQCGYNQLVDIASCDLTSPITSPPPLSPPFVPSKLYSASALCIRLLNMIQG